MSFLELAKRRYSVRSYSAQPVEEEKIQQILEAARIAPTAKNLQPQKIYILKSPESIEKIRAITASAYNAPLVFLICADVNLSWRSPFDAEYESGEMDGSIAAAHMMLEAADLGLGSVWVKMFDAKKVSRAFGLPENIQPVCLLPVGYAADGSRPSERHEASRPLEEMVVTL